MVSIAGKVPTARSATAVSVLLFAHPKTYSSLLAARLRKGDALAVARVAGIQAAKKTADLIPLAHPGLNITSVAVRLEPFISAPPYPLTRKALPSVKYGGVVITADVTCEGKTGVEMEAITGASVAGLTMYDMLKAIDKAMVLTATRVVAKSGGKSGGWRYDFERNEIVKDEPDVDLEDLPREIRADEIHDEIAAKQAEVDRPVAETEHAAGKPGPVSAADFEAARRARLARVLQARGRNVVAGPDA
jgi:molybdenum cofactor biosynthesis protein MoaC